MADIDAGARDAGAGDARAVEDDRPVSQVDAGSQVDVDRALLGGATYRGIAGQRLSDAEERFEKRRRTLGLLLAPLLALIFLALPLDMPARQQTLAGILIGVIVLWITEAVPIPVGGLIGVAAIVLMGVAFSSSSSGCPS